MEAIRIVGFRKYHDFSLEGFGQINFILGNNNIGKTSILESIYAWACGQNVVPFINIPLARARYGGNQTPYWVMEELLATVHNRSELPLQMSFDGTYDGHHVCFEHTIYPSELLGEYDSSYKNLYEHMPIGSNEARGGEVAQTSMGLQNLFQIPQVSIAKWDVRHNGSVVSANIAVPSSITPTVKSFRLAKFIDVLSHTAAAETVQIYGSLKRERLLEKIAKEVSRTFPEIKGFDLIPYPDGSQSPISVIKGDAMLPLYACGDGVQRWFYILGAMTLYKKSLMCIDEIDTGFHLEAQSRFAVDLVRSALGNDVQLFVTTHNIEFVDNFLRAVTAELPGAAQATRVITLRDTAAGTRARVLDAVGALDARDDFNLELR